MDLEALGQQVRRRLVTGIRRRGDRHPGRSGNGLVPGDEVGEHRFGFGDPVGLGERRQLRESGRAPWCDLAE